MTALRSFVAVADHGGVTRAAGMLNFTQSAVSMQLKRLEDTLGLALFDRSNRRIALTASGEQLLGYARRIVEMNDEAMTRLTCQTFEGEIVLGVPHDIIYPVLPRVLHRFNSEFPRMKVQLISSYTRSLKANFAQGAVDIILTTEATVEPGGETLDERPLRWIGAPNGAAWRQRPLRYAACRDCGFRAGVIRNLETAGVDWEQAVDTDSDRTIEATVTADLAITAMIEGTEPPHLMRIEHLHDLPDLALQKINMYMLDRGLGEVQQRMAELIRTGFASWGGKALQAVTAEREPQKIRA